MGIFFSASIHPKAGFLLGAYVYSPVDLNKRVARELRDWGWEPGEDELRVGHSGWCGAAAAPVRDRLQRVLTSQCRIGVLVLPSEGLLTLGTEALRALAFFFQKHSFPRIGHDVFFDRGIFAHPAHAGRLASHLGPLPSCRFHFEQNARRILSLQLAGLAAHTCATDLAEPSALGIRRYLVSALYVSPDCPRDLRATAEIRLAGSRGSLH